MAKLQKCLIQKCLYIICPRCQHWYKSTDPEQIKMHTKCVERAANRTRLLTCPGCRQSMFGYWGDATLAECDARDEYVQMLHNRFAYRRSNIAQYQRLKGQRLKAKTKQVRNLRATSAAPTTKAV